MNESMNDIISCVVFQKKFRMHASFCSSCSFYCTLNYGTANGEQLFEFDAQSLHISQSQTSTWTEKLGSKQKKKIAILFVDWAMF